MTIDNVLAGCLSVRFGRLHSGNVASRSTRFSVTATVGHHTRFRAISQFGTGQWFGRMACWFVGSRLQWSSIALQQYSRSTYGYLVLMLLLLEKKKWIYLCRHWSWVSRWLYENTSWIQWIIYGLIVFGWWVWSLILNIR